MLVSTVVYVVLLAVGGHLFVRWLYREMRRADAPTEPPPPWKWRRTLGGLMVVLLMFAAGTAAVGVAHQTTWLVRSPESLYRKGSPTRAKILCTRNLTRIGDTIQTYARSHDGRYPDDLAALLDEDLEPHALICPGPPDAPYEVADTIEQAKLDLAKRGHLSYFYFGKGLTQPVDADRVIVVESLENHDGAGINLLYGDGRVRWKDRAEAEALLTKLGFERVEVRR